MMIRRTDAFEVTETAHRLNIECELLSKATSAEFTALVYKQYQPTKRIGHLSIGGEIEKYRLEVLKRFLDVFPEQPMRVLFSQTDRGGVVELSNARSWSQIAAETYVDEYFLAAPNLDYLIAVNWYVLEAAGTARTLFAECETTKDFKIS